MIPRDGARVTRWEIEASEFTCDGRHLTKTGHVYGETRASIALSGRVERGRRRSDDAAPRLAHPVALLRTR